MELRQGNSDNFAINVVLAIISSFIVLIGLANITGFDMLYSVWILLLPAFLLCAVYALAHKANKQKLFYPVSLILLLMITLFAGQFLVQGFCLVWNQIGDTYVASTGRVIPYFEVADSDKKLVSLIIFSLFVGFFISLICISVMNFKKTVLAISIPTIIFVLMILFDKELSLIYVAIMLLMSLCLILCEDYKNEKKPIGASLNRLVPVMTVGIALVLVSAVPAVQSWADDIEQETKIKFHKERYETEHTTLPEGKLVDFEDDKDKNHVALVVNMSKPEETYLRGFTGATYEKGVWKPLDTKALAENKELLYWMNQNQYDSHILYEKAVDAVSNDTKEKESTNSIMVQNINACNKYMYVPYNLCDGEYIKNENISLDGLVSEGNRSYMYFVESGGTQKISETINSLNSSNTEKAQSYKEVENTYRKFIYNNYLQIPNDVKEDLLLKWEKHTASYGKLEELSENEIQECAMAFLETVEGNSFEYATIATLTLRYYGIPARYAEGYVITQDMIDEQEDPSSISVDGNCGMAWVEVYQDGIGWLPANITLGINEDELEEPEEEDTPLQKPEPGEELEEEAEQPLEEPVPQGGYMVTIAKSIPVKLILGFVALALVIIAFVLRRKFLLDKRKKLIEKETAKDAVAIIFADTVKLLKKLGIERSNGSLMELYETIKNLYDDSYAKEFENMVKLNSRAMFSSRKMDEEEIKTAEFFYDKTLELLKNNSKWYKKLWMQWILCLY